MKAKVLYVVYIRHPVTGQWREKPICYGTRAAAELEGQRITERTGRETEIQEVVCR